MKVVSLLFLVFIKVRRSDCSAKLVKRVIRYWNVFQLILLPYYRTIIVVAAKDSKISFFLVKRCEVIIFDSFDTSDFAVLPYGADERPPPHFYFNESAEEIYGHYDQRILV